MAFKLTYSDGQETDYDDDTAWEVDDGVLKMGRKEGEWTVLVSPSHWAVLEVGGKAAREADDAEPSDDDDSDDDSEPVDEDSDDDGGAGDDRSKSGDDKTKSGGVKSEKDDKSKSGDDKSEKKDD